MQDESNHKQTIPKCSSGFLIWDHTKESSSSDAPSNLSFRSTGNSSLKNGDSTQSAEVSIINCEGEIKCCVSTSPTHVKKEGNAVMSNEVDFLANNSALSVATFLDSVIDNSTSSLETSVQDSTVSNVLPCNSRLEEEEGQSQTEHSAHGNSDSRLSSASKYKKSESELCTTSSNSSSGSRSKKSSTHTSSGSMGGQICTCNCGSGSKWSSGESDISGMGSSSEFSGPGFRVNSYSHLSSVSQYQYRQARLGEFKPVEPPLLIHSSAANGVLTNTRQKSASVIAPWSPIGSIFNSRISIDDNLYSLSEEKCRGLLTEKKETLPRPFGEFLKPIGGTAEYQLCTGELDASPEERNIGSLKQYGREKQGIHGDVQVDSKFTKQELVRSVVEGEKDRNICSDSNNDMVVKSLDYCGIPDKDIREPVNTSRLSSSCVRESLESAYVKYSYPCQPRSQLPRDLGTSHRVTNIVLNGKQQVYEHFATTTPSPFHQPAVEMHNIVSHHHTTMVDAYSQTVVKQETPLNSVSPVSHQHHYQKSAAKISTGLLKKSNSIKIPKIILEEVNFVTPASHPQQYKKSAANISSDLPKKSNSIKIPEKKLEKVTKAFTSTGSFHELDLRANEVLLHTTTEKTSPLPREKASIMKGKGNLNTMKSKTVAKQRYKFISTKNRVPFIMCGQFSDISSNYEPSSHSNICTAEVIQVSAIQYFTEQGWSSSCLKTKNVPKRNYKPQLQQSYENSEDISPKLLCSELKRNPRLERCEELTTLPDVQPPPAILELLSTSTYDTDTSETYSNNSSLTLEENKVLDLLL